VDAGRSPENISCTILAFLNLDKAFAIISIIIIDGATKPSVAIQLIYKSNYGCLT